ncbi:hypothetical protein OC846_004781 [Tilletia horrida]|uniref:Uncharacterized protein n=1 Tax=Tilletia horrida TaxID=155126 RepID=A0AAN6JQU6_9BASI|nr:hypothetical protein OC845_005013 [Tilletia horrida]KAK0547641.1 hypothetical protein OC846_004781 [Tilletia horrida]KAK0562669.1 hypothetical protein OC861_005193 [Tilletia horrida]
MVIALPNSVVMIYEAANASFLKTEDIPRLMKWDVGQVIETSTDPAHTQKTISVHQAAFDA